MYVLLFIAGDVLTITGTYYIYLNSNRNILVDIGKKGYKLDKKFIAYYNSKVDNEYNNMSKKESVIGGILSVIPGVNMIRCAYRIHRDKKNLYKEIEEKNALIPMTESEKEIFKSLGTKMEKMTYVSSLSIMLDGEKYIGNISGIPLIYDTKSLDFDQDTLTPLSYTLNDVKRLNNATNGLYVTGKMNDVNVAVIGVKIPDGKTDIKRLDIKGKKYNYTPFVASDDDKFIVYPYSDDARVSANKVVDEIIEERKNNKTSNFETTNTIKYERPKVLTLKRK